jgi:hypothetical protein
MSFAYILFAATVNSLQASSELTFFAKGIAAAVVTPPNALICWFSLSFALLNRPEIFWVE